jgi:hypothetical protein
MSDYCGGFDLGDGTPGLHSRVIPGLTEAGYSSGLDPNW